MSEIMINKVINNNTSESKVPVQKEPKKPNEVSGVHISGHIKIFDPNTKEVYIDKRED